MAGLTDWNDLLCEAGPDVVRQQLMDQMPELPQRDPRAARAGDEGGKTGEQGDMVGPDLEWMLGLSKNKDGSFSANIFNARLVLANDDQWRDVIGYCEFSYRVIKRRPPPFSGGQVGEWTDADTDRMRIWFCSRYGFTPKTADADGAVLVVAQDNPFHPVRDYLESLQWDGTPRLRAWLETYMGAKPVADDEEQAQRYRRYVSLVGTKWMVAAVARVMRPPCKADCVLILEGRQGVGKSTALAILGGSWFTDTHFALGEKDGYQQMQGAWICELAELDAFNKAESTRAKQFFASEEDRYRPAYGRRVQSFARQCVFAGTTNQDGYLKDPTGNRRYWPVFCHAPDMEALRQARDQLWAEAVQLYRLGEKWWVEDHDKPLFEAEQEARFMGDAWEEVIATWLSSTGGAGSYHTTSDIMKGALHMDSHQMKPPEQTRVGQIMARLGWKRVRRSVLGRRPWVYERPDDWPMGGESVPPVPPPEEGGTG